jgi:hypothetical protein
MSPIKSIRVTHKPQPKKKRQGDVPTAQLYREIDAGWRYFIANRMERETLKGPPVRIR